MTWFAVETRYIADRDRLLATRPRHREYLVGLAEQGAVLAGGPFTDDKSGFAVYRVADRAELDRLLADDPYTTEGIAAGREVREWRITLGPWADAQ
jgi:uncharacterized protein YciI